MRRAVILLLLACAGCKMETEASSARPERMFQVLLGSTAPPDSIVVWDVAPQSAKVAAVMAANDITLPQVVAYLYGNGWTVVPAPLPSAHWKPAKPGSSPVAYYLWEMSGAVGDTSMPFYLPQTAGAVALRVKAVDTDGLHGEWSEVGVSSGGLLPGVGVE